MYTHSDSSAYKQDFPGYQVIDKLGESQAVVYKAINIATNKIVAIKTYEKIFSDTIARFENEVNTLKRLSHPNIIRLIEDRVTSTPPYIILEYIDGDNVDNLIMQTSPRNFTHVIELGLQLTAGLIKIHNTDSTIHRDIKSENILYTIDKATGKTRFIIIDFGIAKGKNSSNQTSTGHTPLTEDYASPEQLTSRLLNHKTDFFSMGVVLYKFLEGRFPFSEPPRSIQQHNIFPFSYQLSQEMPAKLLELIYGLLSFEPNDRPNGLTVMGMLTNAYIECISRTATQTILKDIKFPPIMPGLLSVPNARHPMFTMQNTVFKHAPHVNIPSVNIHSTVLEQALYFKEQDDPLKPITNLDWLNEMKLRNGIIGMLFKLLEAPLFLWIITLQQLFKPKPKK